MPKKRTSTESSSDEQTDKDSDPFQEDAKRVKLASISDTTLQDLPIELIQCILIRAVTMEVKDMKLAKSVWKEKVDLVISRLAAVCSQWSDILTTNYFRNELHRYLDQTAQETPRLEILYQSRPLQFSISSIATMKNEIFLLCTAYGRGDFLNIYDRDNMAMVKDVISLSGYRPHSIDACSVSNCVYVLCRVRYNNFSVWRIAKDDEHQYYNVTPFGSSMYLPYPHMYVTGNGSLVFSRLDYGNRAPMVICDANGCNEHEMRFPPNFSYLRSIIPKSNGNLVLTTGWPIRELTEIDMDGKVIRQYKPPWQVMSYLYASIRHSDKFGRILLIGNTNEMELLDSEFNLINFNGQLIRTGQHIPHEGFYYNSERDEMVTLVGRNDKRFLTIFRLTEN